MTALVRKCKVWRLMCWAFLKPQWDSVCAVFLLVGNLILRALLTRPLATKLEMEGIAA